MTAQFIQPMNPAEMDEMFCQSDRLIHHGYVPTEKDKKSPFGDSELEQYVSLLPEMERDFLYLYYELDKTQPQIAHIYKVTQPAVSHRLIRARERLKFLHDRPDISYLELYETLTDHLTENNSKYLTCYWITTHQSRSAEICNVSFPFIHQRIRRSIKNLSFLTDDRINPIYEHFKEIKSNPCILTPQGFAQQWDHPDKHEDYD